MELTANILERNGCPIHYWIGGKADAPLVVFTHGATVDHHEWDATLSIVGEHFRILTWDMRGHGLSRPALFNLAGIVIGLIFGALAAVIPARQAARLQVVEALRYE